MSDSSTIRIELTAEQKRIIADQTGKEIAALEFTAEELEQRIAPLRPPSPPSGPIPMPYPI
ncbi:MAG: hypothetical protein WEE89_16740 [Gemmatimonadota bacterium]